MTKTSGTLFFFFLFFLFFGIEQKLHYVKKEKKQTDPIPVHYITVTMSIISSFSMRKLNPITWQYIDII